MGELGGATRVVSMPCFERFDRQASAYKAKVLPSGVTKRIAIEAGVTALWYKYVGLDGKVIGVDRFGFSAPGNIVMDAFGINARHIVEVAKSMSEGQKWEAATCSTNTGMLRTLERDTSSGSLPTQEDTSSPSEESESSLSGDELIGN